MYITISNCFLQSAKSEREGQATDSQRHHLDSTVLSMSSSNSEMMQVPSDVCSSTPSAMTTGTPSCSAQDIARLRTCSTEVAEAQKRLDRTGSMITELSQMAEEIVTLSRRLPVHGDGTGVSEYMVDAIEVVVEWYEY